MIEIRYTGWVACHKNTATPVANTEGQILVLSEWPTIRTLEDDKRFDILPVVLVVRREEAR